MAKKASFSASAWIAENTYGGTTLSKTATQAVADFTTMWNFFESTLCQNRATIAAFERIAIRFQAPLPRPTKEAIEQCLSFWQFRYRTPNGFGHRFEALYFRPNDKRHHVESVLNGQTTEQSAKTLALMIIVYRLRNNLFHGLKTLDMLNDQVDNLSNASRCLATILEHLRPHPMQ